MQPFLIVQAQIDYLAEELSRKDILTQEVEILKEFSIQLQQEQQSSVQGGPCFIGPDVQICVDKSWKRLLLLPNKRIPKEN